MVSCERGDDEAIRVECKDRVRRLMVSCERGDDEAIRVS